MKTSNQDLSNRSDHSSDTTCLAHPLLSNQKAPRIGMTYNVNAKAPKPPPILGIYHVEHLLELFGLAAFLNRLPWGRCRADTWSLLRNALASSVGPPLLVRRNSTVWSLVGIYPMAFASSTWARRIVTQH